MPKSRGRRKSSKKRAPVRRTPTVSSQLAGSGRGQYDVGTVRSSQDQIATLLLSDRVAPDLMVELLPPMLWLEHAVGHPRNLCVSSCITLHFAYAALGITAIPRAVDLVVSDQRTDQRTMYGRPNPSWSEDTFHGHCVLWLPGSGRFIDPTVEQYPEIRRHRLGPICGRIAAAMVTPDQRSRLAGGELVPGTHIGVRREDLLLLYTTVDHEFDDVVMSGPSMPTHRAEYLRSGRNLAMQTLSLLANPDVLDRARRSPHQRVRALLDHVAGAELIENGPELGFVLRDDPTRAPRGLDELLEAKSVPAQRSESAPTPTPAAPPPTPAPTSPRSLWKKLVGREG